MCVCVCVCVSVGGGVCVVWCVCVCVCVWGAFGPPTDEEWRKTECKATSKARSGSTHLRADVADLDPRQRDVRLDVAELQQEVVHLAKRVTGGGSMQTRQEELSGGERVADPKVLPADHQAGVQHRVVAEHPERTRPPAVGQR